MRRSLVLCLCLVGIGFLIGLALRGSTVTAAGPAVIGGPGVTVVASCVTLVDEQGRSRGIFSVVDGQPQISISHPNGNMAAGLTATADGSGQLAVGDSTGQAKACILMSARQPRAFIAGGRLFIEAGSKVGGAEITDIPSGRTIWKAP
jgi:hypothetical protein